MAQILEPDCPASGHQTDVSKVVGKTAAQGFTIPDSETHLRLFPKICLLLWLNIQTLLDGPRTVGSQFRCLKPAQCVTAEETSRAGWWHSLDSHIQSLTTGWGLELLVYKKGKTYITGVP